MPKSSRLLVAEFLADEVGEGNVFTIHQLREAVPGFAQVDRRLRDLRSAGWIIHSHIDDGALQPGEYRFVSRAETISSGGGVSGRLRREILDAATNRCQVCGVAAGEEYSDQPGRRAKLQVGHIKPRELGGSNDPQNLRAECSRCNEAIRHKAGTADSDLDVWAKIRDMPRRDRLSLLKWMDQGHRDFDPVEQMWAEFRQLSPTDQSLVRDRLSRNLAGSHPAD